MATLSQPHLFSWTQVDAASDLDRLGLVLAVIPDERFVRHLEKLRANGRDDYPVRPTWNLLLAGIVYQHPSAASLLREARRNPQLRHVCGFDPCLGDLAVPTDDAFGRLLQNVIEAQDKLVDVFNGLVRELARELPDLGKHLAADSKALASHGRPVRDPEKLDDPDGRRDTDADWGCKTYKGQRADGTTWEKVKYWFGYKLHLIVDSVYEMPLAFKLTKASTGDSPELLPLVGHLMKRQPAIAKQEDKDLSADKAYDSEENNKTLYETHHIVPVIDKRTLWREETTKALYDDRVEPFIYDEHGQVYCVDSVTGERREMFFAGFEKDRDCLRYRCPAAANGFECKSREDCDANHCRGNFGRVVRVPLAKDWRIFTPIARPTQKWKTAYNRRSAVERVNSRIDRVLGFEEHFIRGHAKMETRVTLGLVVMLAMALGRIRANQRDLMRSLTAPVRRAA